MLPIGIVVCLSLWLAGRFLARTSLGLAGVRLTGGVAHDRYFRAPAGRRAAFRAAGPLCAYLVVVALAWGAKLSMGLWEPTTTVDVLPDSPAAQAGLQSGDRILAVGEQPVSTWDAIREGVRRGKPGSPLAFHFVRVGGEDQGPRTLSATRDARGRVGITPRQERLTAPPLAALAAAAAMPFTAPRDMVRAALRTLRGHEPITLRGPVALVKEVTAQGPAQAKTGLFLLAVAYPGAALWPLCLLLELCLTPRRDRKIRV